MSKQGNGNRFPLEWIVGIAIALFAAGGGFAWFTYSKLTSSPHSVPPSSPSLSPSPSTEPSPSQLPQTEPPPVAVSPQPAKTSPSLVKPQTETVQVYWIKITDTGSELLPGIKTVRKSTSKSTVLKQAFETLLNGPTDSVYTTTIPQGTKLLGLTEDKNGIRVNLSQAFTTGDGPDMLMGRLGQVIYTATSLDPQAPVWIAVEGKPLELLGEGDGIVVDQPMTRQSFEENFQLSSQ